MPLLAFVNGEQTDASQLDASAWNSLRNSRPRIELGCCRAKGFMRTSRLGTPHFIHAKKSDVCATGPESDEHLALKSVVANAIREAGWIADVEAIDQNGRWRADVMARRNSARIAFEIQLSPITSSEFHRRQDAYAASNVRGCWFYGPKAFGASPPVNLEAPLFSIGAAGNVAIGPRTMHLADGVSSLLKGHFRRCTSMRVTTVQKIVIYRFSRCWACGKDFDIYSITELAATCGDEMLAEGEWDGAPLSLKKSGAPWIAERVKRYVKDHPRQTFQLSFPQWCEAASSRRKHYTFCCFHCGFLIAEEIIEQLLYSGECSQDLSYYLSPIAGFRFNRRNSTVDHPHWCFSTARRFCDVSI